MVIIANEEVNDRGPHQVPIALLGEEFDRESTRVTGSIGRSFLSADGGKPNKNGCLFANVAEEVGRA
jgi:hypothetical protein